MECIFKFQGNQHLYKMDFEENGSKFEENILINKEKGYLIYDVPEHNDIQAARFLKDFKAVSFCFTFQIFQI